MQVPRPSVPIPSTTTVTPTPTSPSSSTTHAATQGCGPTGARSDRGLASQASLREAKASLRKEARTTTATLASRPLRGLRSCEPRLEHAPPEAASSSSTPLALPDADVHIAARVLHYLRRRTHLGIASALAGPSAPSASSAPPTVRGSAGLAPAHSTTSTAASPTSPASRSAQAPMQGDGAPAGPGPSGLPPLGPASMATSGSNTTATTTITTAPPAPQSATPLIASGSFGAFSRERHASPGPCSPPAPRSRRASSDLQPTPDGGAAAVTRPSADSADPTWRARAASAVTLREDAHGSPGTDAPSSSGAAASGAGAGAGAGGGASAATAGFLEHVQKLARTNDPFELDPRASTFRGSSDFDLGDFVECIVQGLLYTLQDEPTVDSLLAHAACLLDRLPHACLKSTTTRRFVFLSLYLSLKAIVDETVSISAYSQITRTRVRVSEIAALERRFVALLDWRVLVSAEDVTRRSSGSLGGGTPLHSSSSASSFASGLDLPTGS